MEQHALSATTLQALADGYGGAEAVAELWRGQESRRLLLFKLAHDHLADTTDRRTALKAVFEAEDREPELVRAILVDPMVALWAAGIVRRAPRETVPLADIVRLNEIAVAAAMWAESDVETRGWSRNGWVSIPTIGRLPVSEQSGPVRLVVTKGLLSVDGLDRDLDDPGWQHARTVTVGDDTDVQLEDIDPCRDTFHIRAAERLSDSDFDVWRRALDAAWQILTQYCPERVLELSAGLHALVPFPEPENRTAHSATARDAIGVIGLDLPKDPAELAVTLIHEFQHSKLSSVLDVLDLYRPSDRLFFAPWRTDARPISGLLQGVYAFIAVADTWARLSAVPERFPRAQREFAESRAQVSEALDTLAGSDLLTSAGERFLTGMRGAVNRLNSIQLPTVAEAAAERLLADRRAAWQIANPAAS
ncbi:HEXXH motif domain-containing protein [Actinoplanes palleronii]|uniref:HEXXH motif domain-containing protein n=1 Tax=Actinoplanes palleronii TaxID=113570 RepID=UPI0019456C42|nr:HEXXH motif domain-containing protein [Actinoplanes palleronii]